MPLYQFVQNDKELAKQNECVIYLVMLHLKEFPRSMVRTVIFQKQITVINVNHVYFIFY